MGRRAVSTPSGREPRPLRPLADGQDSDETFVHQPEVAQGPVSARDGAPDVALADPRIEERIQADTPYRRLNARPDVAGRFGVGRMVATTDSGDASARFGVVPDLHGPKAAKAASTSSSVAYDPASDCARPRSIEARSSSLSVSQIERSAAATASDAGSVGSAELVVVGVPGVFMPSTIASPSRHRRRRTPGLNRQPTTSVPSESRHP